MKLEKYLKLDEMSDFFKKNQITVSKSNIGIKLVTCNNLTILIHKQTHVLPDSEPLIYMDCPLIAFGLPDFRRNWHENENLSDYLRKTVIPYVVKLAGPFTQDESTVGQMIINKLEENGIKVDKNMKEDLIFKEFDSQGKEIDSYINNRPMVSFHYDGFRYGINYHKCFLSLCFFKQDETNEISMSYPWYSFCPAFIKGQEFIDTTINGMVRYIKGRY